MQIMWDGLKNTRPEQWVEMLVNDKEKLLETEKQQIIEAHKKGQLWNKSGYNPGECERYYSKTYNQ